MIVSAEMGNSVGDTEYLTEVIIKQVIYALIGLACYFLFMIVKPFKFKVQTYYFAYFVLLGILVLCRFFGQINGAYAWISFGNMSIQPSEFAKVFMILFGAKLFEKDHKERNYNNFVIFAVAALILFFTIAVIQKDFGSAIVLFVICYCILLIPSYIEIRKLQNYMAIGVVVVIGIIFIVLSSPVTEFLKKYSDNYMIGRFLAAANPFLYRYDNGYHVIMSLVSFASGGLLGLGYGNSIHKYMNFPNPSNDFILPIIVEELGVVGFVAFIVAYCFLLFPIMRYSFKTKSTSTKMLLLGVFSYFIVHFILNVGGVSAIIPLTGVPLLLISSGGSSLIASLIGLGLVQGELKKIKVNNNEDNSGKI